MECDAPPHVRLLTNTQIPTRLDRAGQDRMVEKEQTDTYVDADSKWMVAQWPSSVQCRGRVNLPSPSQAASAVPLECEARRHTRCGWLAINNGCRQVTLAHQPSRVIACSELNVSLWIGLDVVSGARVRSARSQK